MSSTDSNLPPIPRRDSPGLRSAGDTALPPHPLDKRWYAHVDGQNYGPYTGHDIRRMAESDQIRADDFLCAEGANEWIVAKDDPLLGSIFARRTAQAPPPPPVITNSGGGTVVQVTNNIPDNSANVAQALLLTSEGGPKSPGVALLLSFLLCGAGQMYNGQIAKGILLLIACIGLWFFFLGWIVWIIGMIDAYSTAKDKTRKYQRRLIASLSR